LAEPSLLAPVIRTLGIVRKEVWSVIRQPRLVITLILGPFLIVLVFGLGYRSTPAPYRTIVVMEDGNGALAADPDELAEVFGDAIELVDVTNDAEDARQRLRQREADLVIVAPTDPVAALSQNQQANFVVVHDQVDPAIRAHIRLLAEISVNRINRRVLEEFASKAQDELAAAREAVDNAAGQEAGQSELTTYLQQAQDVDPELLVSPFSVEIEQGGGEEPPGTSIYYVPGTLVLLMQHIAVTFAALSLVRERQLGLTQVFRVSPIRVTELLAGKYLAFLLVTGAVAAVLTATMIAFGVPLPESWLSLGIVMTLVILGSLGLGFLISAISQNDSQAVQYSMTLLLLSIFFTGFMLPLDQLIPPAQVISYLIPATYGVMAVQDLLFNALPPDTTVVLGLALYALAGALVSWLAIRREVVATAT
jgi:ABC-2 type transport system permease protein